MNKKIVVGLTGGIASGKTTVLQEFKQLGIPTIDCDILARKAVTKGQPALQKISQKFGRVILKKNGTLHRKKLAKIIFNDDKKRKNLENILHPAILKLLKEKIKLMARPMVIVDIPLLFEAHWTPQVDAIVLVKIPKPLQIQRLMRRNHYSKAQAMERIQTQWPTEKKAKLADYIVDNSKNRKSVSTQIKKILTSLNVNS